MAVQLIVNADDFGSSAEVNAAIAKARMHGLLTSASLMVTGDCSREAVDMARRDPDLAVGLHLALSDARSLLPPSQAPLLVDNEGRFRQSPARAAFRYFRDSRTGEQLRREIEAQFRAFADTGLPLSHVDGHQHLHLHPAVLPTVLELAVRGGATGLRMPREPFWRSTRIDRCGICRRAVVACSHAFLCAGACKQVLQAGLESCGGCIGSLLSGRMNTGYVIAMLGSVKRQSVEVFFHPSTADSGHACGPNRGDLDTLLDPRFRRFVEEQGYEPTSYAAMGKRVSVSGNR